MALINNISNSSNPLRDDDQLQLVQLINQLDVQQSLWLSGYLAARAEFLGLTPDSEPSLARSGKNSSTKQPKQQPKLTVLYGSQTGHGESVAKQLLQQANASGIATELYSLADFSVKQLNKKSIITLIISTHGEGEAPDDAELFYEQLFSHKAPKLTQLKYSVLALGDSSYELFCQTGKDIDHRLAELGAEKIHQRVDCDVDYDDSASNWIAAVIPELKQLTETETSVDNITTLQLQSDQGKVNKSVADKHNPYQAEILSIQKITARDSSKNTFHIELAVDPELIEYQPGDSLAVVAQNNAQNVQQLLDYWQLSGTELFTFKGHKSAIRQLLTTHIEITQLSKPCVQFLANSINHPELQNIATSHQAFTDYCQKHQLLDLLQTFDSKQQTATQDILGQLKSVTPRLYSIASAQTACEDELHLTINLEAATPNGHLGLASGLLCKHTQVGDEVSIYIQPNANFRLPENQAAPIIMIGPGTGVAPFRAFMQQRQLIKSAGDNWLFFGNPNFSSDFLYQTEWLKQKKAGVLNNLSVAFSRDQAHKVYVQNKIEQQAAEVWQWLENGAHLYVCGDANRMAKDVEKSLITVISEEGQMNPETAQNYLKQLKRDHRYQKDVY